MASARDVDMNAFSNLEDNIRLCIKQIEDGERGTESKGKFKPDQYWTQFCLVCKALSLEGTKLSLAFSKPPFPDVKECEALAGSTETAILQLVSVFYSLPKSQGTTLRKEVKQAVLQIMQNTLGLISSVRKLDPGGEERKQATGIVWEGAEANVSDLPKDNCQAARKILEQSDSLVKDALEEIEELASKDGQEEDFFNNSDIEDGGDLDNAEVWTAHDKELVAPIKGLIKTVVKLLKKTRETCKQRGKCDSEVHVTQLDDVSDAAQRLSPAIDDLLPNLYAPVDYKGMKDNASALSEVIDNMLSILRNSHITDEGDMTWLEFLHKANSHNLNILLNLLNKP